jgi:hypothetical protein
MPTESIILQAPNGKQTAGSAEILRYSNANRIIRASLFVLGGLIGGTVCILIPIVHLITTWGLPLLGIVMAIRTMRRDVVIHQPQGTCPNCNEHIQLPGGAASDPEWQVCSHCKTHLQIRPLAETLATSPPPPPQ